LTAERRLESPATPAHSAREVQRLASPDRKSMSNHFCRMAAQLSALDGLPLSRPTSLIKERSLRSGAASGSDVCTHPGNDLTHRGSRREHLHNAHLRKRLTIGVGNDATAKEHDVVGVGSP
jgi:hypothetical protein